MKHAWVFGEILLAALFVLLTLGVHNQLLQTFDLETTVLLQRIFPRSVDLPFSLLSLLGSAEITTVILLVLVLFVSRPTLRAKPISLFLLVGLIEWLGKNLVSQPGPPDDLLRYVRLFSMPTAHVVTPFSFPSGHAARVVFLTVIAAVWIAHSNTGTGMKKILLVLLPVGAAAMLVSRISLGEHWASDVIGGTLLGAAAALLSEPEAFSISSAVRSRALWRDAPPVASEHE
jgi:membrane-associated phospholipid phosphatase